MVQQKLESISSKVRLMNSKEEAEFERINSDKEKL